MRSLARLTILLAILAAGQSFGRPTCPAQDPKETGTITGRVTLDGKPAQGVNVIATPSGADPAKMMARMLNRRRLQRPQPIPTDVTDWKPCPPVLTT